MLITLFYNLVYKVYFLLKQFVISWDDFSFTQLYFWRLFFTFSPHFFRSLLIIALPTQFSDLSVLTVVPAERFVDDAVCAIRLNGRDSGERVRGFEEDFEPPPPPPPPPEPLPPPLVVLVPVIARLVSLLAAIGYRFQAQSNMHRSYSPSGVPAIRAPLSLSVSRPGLGS